MGAPLPDYKPYVPIKFEDQVRVLLDARVPVFSFIAGVPPKEILDECRMQGIRYDRNRDNNSGSDGSGSGEVNVVVASGFEAGGHRSSILLPAEDSLTGTFSLTPQVVDLFRTGHGRQRYRRCARDSRRFCPWSRRRANGNRLSGE